MTEKKSRRPTSSLLKENSSLKTDNVSNRPTSSIKTTLCVSNENHQHKISNHKCFDSMELIINKNK